jgi:NADH:ubiquinone oxidoreductase subunit 6 (subunit J)
MIIGYKFAFIVLATITVVSAVMVVVLPNILRSALFLALAFLGISGLYVLLNAEFLFAMQILIYVGAITMLILFAIMLTQQLMGAKLRETSSIKMMLMAAPVVIAAFALMIKVFASPFKSGGTMVASAPAKVNADTLHQLAGLLLQPYVVPFELASFILLAALVGAIVIAKEEKD